VSEVNNSETKPIDGTQSWNAVAERLDAFVRRWEHAIDPPDLAGHLAADDPFAVRRAILTELIKVDLDQRWARGLPKRIEEYAAEFPELAAADGIPRELIVEEYHVRRRHATAASSDEYLERFPQWRDELVHLIGNDAAVRAIRSNAGRSDRLTAGQSVDDFDLLAAVGQGSFATVFLARQRSLQRLVALKVSADHGSEPQTLAQLDHPYIVRVYDQRVLPDRAVRLLYMPYLPGGTLRDVLHLVRATPVEQRTSQLILKSVDDALARRGELPPTDSNNRQQLASMTWPETVCWLGIRLADALEYAHLKGVLHCDVKPANVLLGADAAPRLADFNVSESRVKGEKTFGGSFGYMSPEQLEAFDPKHERKPDSLDGRADVFSLAVTLWELLTGSRPFPEDSKGRIREISELTILHRKPLSPELVASLPANMPNGLADVLTRALSPHPGDRFAAGEFARQLDLCLKPQTRKLLFPKPGWRTWVARHPILSLFSVGLIPNVVASWFNIEYNRTAIIKPFPAVAETFQVLQVIVNGTFFPICILLFGWFLWPVIKGLPRAMQNELSEPECAVLRRRTLKLGTISVLVCLWAWVAAGAIFPIVMHLSVHQLPVEVHLHFLASQTLCGLMAVAYPQFGVTFLALRCFYPRLIRNATLTRTDAGELAATERVQTRYLLVAACVPMLAVGLLAGIASENRIALFIISVISLIGFGVVTWLTTEIRADRGALEAIVAD
jgi:serine/threonine protein kinase